MKICRMQRLIVVLAAALAACSSAPLRPLPAADWASGAKVLIEAPSGIPASYDSEIKAASARSTPAGASART